MAILEDFCMAFANMQVSEMWPMGFLSCILCYARGFALYHDKSLQIYFFCVKRQAKNNFLKDVESTVNI